MSGRISLARGDRSVVVSLVPLIDVLLILLVFFMVTSSYLDLDMIPAVRPEQGNAAPVAQERRETVLLRLGADGIPVVSGAPIPIADLPDRLAGLSEETNLVILPSGAANTQGLVAVLDAAATAGVTRLRVIRLEAGP